MKCLVFFALLLSPQSLLAAKIQIITTTTDLAWVAQKIGQDRVRVESLLNGSEDAHYLDAKPSFIRKVSNADIVCFNGLALEIGWLPKVLKKSGNAKVQSGGNGYCDASKEVEVIEKLAGQVDRSMGDVHPEGNPHYTLSPDHLAQAADSIFSVIVGIDSKQAAFYLKNLEQLKKDLLLLKQQVQKKFSQKLGASKKMKAIQYHKEFSYFLKSYGITQVEALEPVPGVPPSAGRLAKLGITAKAKGVDVAMGASYSPEKLLKKFTQISSIPYVQLPVSIQKKGPINSYQKLQLHLANQIISKL